MTIEKQIKLPFWWYEYSLKIPNFEIRNSLNNYFLENFFEEENINSKKVNIYNSLENWNIEWFVNTLKSLLAGIPYNDYIKNNIAHFEWYYSALVYVYLQSLGYDIIWEDTTNRARIDLTVKLEDKIYIIEFKMSNFKESPLKQVKEKKYWEKYINSPLAPLLNNRGEREYKKIYLVWIIFDEEERNVVDWEWEEIKKK